jgi:hypothetical protein
MNFSRDAVSFGVAQFALARVGGDIIRGDKNDGISGGERCRLCRNATSIIGTRSDEEHEEKQK